MSNLKFRVWDKESEEMFHQNDKCFVFDSLCGKFNLDYEFGEILEKSRFIVEQFTGLKDKNGKEIYVGDIVKINYYPAKHFVQSTEKLKVVFKDGFFGLDSRDFDFEDDYPVPLWEYALNCLDDRQCKIKIIGNIHENPELLN